ncbi:hypothetical protein [Rhodovulum marinum]|uniref:Uncharacterized protein n=1 Tax=Rhodovulum marinum TaxID=320662 RepID=A0A4R2PXY4_9RHOB|nr:hypothetical protein [Rhodovulum marinum]TCP40990.1 hypothetical protein EV662_106207 [Rhodovulum marinum]
MATPSRSPRPAAGCNGTCADCHHAAHPSEEIDALHLTPLAIVRAEVLAAVDELLETFHARG